MTVKIDSATIISSLETAIELSDKGIVPGLQVEIVAMIDSGTFTFVMGLVFCISFYKPRSTIRFKSDKEIFTIYSWVPNKRLYPLKYYA